MSSASPPRPTIVSIGSGADIYALELRDRAPVPGGHLGGTPLLEIDVDERLVRRHHEHVVGLPIGGELERDTRPPDPRDAAVDLELVVEPRGREVLDIVRPHHEVAVAAVAVQQPE